MFHIIMSIVWLASSFVPMYGLFGEEVNQTHSLILLGISQLYVATHMKN